MIRNLKALGLALVAVFAMSALVASAAQAEFTFTAWETNETNHVHSTFKSEQSAAFGDLFAQTAGKPAFKCEKSPTSATSTTGDETYLTASPTYSNCTIGANLAFVTVLPTTCHYRFHVTSKHTAHEYTGTVDITCTTPGDSIHVQVYTNSGEGTKVCEITIDEQHGINGITYTNDTSGGLKDILVHVNSTNIKTTTTKGGILCQNTTGTNHTTGTFTGTDTVQAFNAGGAQINATISG